MTQGPGAKDPPPTFTDRERAPGQDGLSGMTEVERREILAWVGEHLPQVRRSVYGQRLLYWSLGIGFVVGLAAHVGGYLLKASVTTELLGLVADLLYALGFALWTGAVVVVFAQVIPDVKRRQFKQMLDAYEAAQREKARAESAQGRRVMTERADGEVAVVHTVGACRRDQRASQMQPRGDNVGAALVANG